MSKKKTVVSIILDRSGSMGGTKEQTVQGFNEHVQQAKENSKSQDILVNLVTFNGDVYEHLWMQPAEKLAEARVEDYETKGSTAYRDAIGYTLDKLTKTADIEDEDTAFLVIIISDGEENASCQYTPAALREMTDSLQSTKRWTFSYIGCSSQNVYQVARELNIPVSNCAVWSNRSAKLATKGFAETGKKMHSYYRARAGGASAVECLMSDSPVAAADFSTDDDKIGVAAPPAESWPNLDNPYVPDATPAVVETPVVDWTDNLNRLKSNWVNTGKLRYDPMKGHGGYFGSGNKIVWEGESQAECVAKATMHGTAFGTGTPVARSKNVV